jgi:hypothetical protein
MVTIIRPRALAYIPPPEFKSGPLRGGQIELSLARVDLAFTERLTAKVDLPSGSNAQKAGKTRPD